MQTVKSASSGHAGAPHGAVPLAQHHTGLRRFRCLFGVLSQDKRKKIRQERRKVADAGVTFRAIQGPDITPHEWDFFYRCYERTYLEHGNAPYLNRDFFQRMADTMAQHWVLFIAERDGHPIAISLIAIDAHQTGANGQNDTIRNRACGVWALLGCPGAGGLLAL
jgi:predicted N-acyltransferase